MTAPIASVSPKSTAPASLGRSEKSQNGVKPTKVSNESPVKVPHQSQQQRLLNEAFGAFLSNVKKASAVDSLPLQHVCSTDNRLR
ncbi:hypothetical protein [Stenotrophomonas oahuensis]|uniref:Uncharacterized protein n=1 Tax=Stenotrophomonas oahuensis TaxID=3003271 RepID=A0ABY9YJ85_9GAMM|nr:hypothetical protein [Stenotrophomonas sp. A5586]WNH50949.1 hypothetical protein PDM29_11160 [Stenotrophomonas sp. A5586]